MHFKGNSNVTFDHNTASQGLGGAMATRSGHNIYFEGKSTTVFSNNIGGGIFISYCNVSFQEKPNTVFNDNTAITNSGGGIYIQFSSNIIFKGKSNTIFSHNAAKYGGDIYITYSSNIFFQEKSTTVFSNNINTAYYTGAIHTKDNCSVTFDDSATVVFNVTDGVTVFSERSSKIIAQGNFNVIFNDHLAKWCNSICLPFIDYYDATAIDSDGIVRCSSQRGFYCLSSKCHCKNLEDMLPKADINDFKLPLHAVISENVVLLSSQLELGNHNISIIGTNNPTVLCVNGGGLIFLSEWSSGYRSRNIAINGITWIGCGLADIEVVDFTAVLAFSNYNNVTIQKCSFLYSAEQVVYLNAIRYVKIIDCRFENTGIIQNNDKDGVGIVISDIYLSELTLKNCHFCFNKGFKNIIKISNGYAGIHNNTNVNLIDSVFCNNEGVSVKLYTDQSYSTLYITGEVLFENNVAENGAGISLIGNTSTVIFGENSNTTFVNNSVDYKGAAMYLDYHSSAIFDSNSIVTFANNKATNGTIYFKADSRVKFKEACQITFRDNSATQYGSAIYSIDNSHLIFTGNATVKFSNNNVIISTYKRNGGTVFSTYSGYISFEENSNIMFNDNQADFGAAIYSTDNSSIVFKDRSTVSFNNHAVHYCGVLTSASFSNVTFADHTNVTFSANAVSHSIHNNYESSAGAICTLQNCNITFTNNSLVTFINNRADRGGAVLIDQGYVIIKDYSIVTFYNNFAWYSSGGAFVCSNNSNIMIKDNSNVTFDSNKASKNGGAIYSKNLCKITFKDNSTSTFINNIARDNGGALFSSQLYEITLEGNSLATFVNNTSDYGGVLYFNNFTITFKDSSKVLFCNNSARQSGGVGYCSNGIVIAEDSEV